jgi:hypothetical protein
MNRTLVATAAAIAAFTTLEALLPAVHHGPGGLAAFGAAGCLALVLVARGLAAAGLTRPESADE